MKLANRIKIRVFAKIDDGESEDCVKAALVSLLPFDVVSEKINVVQTTAIGFNERRIKIFEVVLERGRHTNRFLYSLFSRLSVEQKEFLLRTSDYRLDDGLHFYIRLDKHKLMNENALCITDSGDCFHITLSVAAFPRTRDAAKKVLLDALDTHHSFM